MRALILVVLAAASSAFAVGLNSWFVEKALAPRVSVLLSAIIAAAAFACLRYMLTDLPLRMACCRRFLDSRAKHEGYYIETFDEASHPPISVGKISYNHESKSYSYRGQNYGADGVLRQKWRANVIFIDPGLGIGRYFFEETILSENERKQSVRGHGELDFESGSGHYVDSGSLLREHHHGLINLHKKDFRELLGTTAKPEAHDWRKLAMAWLDRSAGDNGVKP